MTVDLAYLNPADSPYQPATLSGRLGCIHADAGQAAASRLTIEEYRLHVAMLHTRMHAPIALAVLLEAKVDGLQHALADAVEQRATDAALIANLQQGMEHAASVALRAEDQVERLRAELATARNTIAAHEIEHAEEAAIDRREIKGGQVVPFRGVR